MDDVQSSTMVSSAPIEGLNCGNYSEITKYMERYLLTLQSSIGNMDEIVFPQFPPFVGNHITTGTQLPVPGPLVSPSQIPTRPDSYTLDDHSESPNSTKLPGTDELMFSTGSNSDAMCVDYRTIKKNVQEVNEMDLSDHSMNSVLVKNRCAVAEKSSNASRLNKFVRRLYDMLCNERNTGLVQWRRGLLVLLDTKVFAKKILPKYFNTRNFKTFRRQLNYYGFVHVRSYSNSGTKSTTALWVNQDLATGKMNDNPDDCVNKDLESISSVLQLKRVDTAESVKTSEGRRERKEQALSTIEDDLGISAQFIALHRLHTLCDGNTKATSEKSIPVILPKCSSQQRRVSGIENQERVTTSLVKNQCRGDSNVIDNSLLKPPTSSVSVANLLLLLSSG